MGLIQALGLPESLKALIERQLAEGRAASEADYFADALRLYADHLEAEDEIALMAEWADADLAAGRYVVVSITEDSEALHEAAMSRLRTRLATDAAKS
jgi:hypothetical protein